MYPRRPSKTYAAYFRFLLAAAPHPATATVATIGVGVAATTALVAVNRLGCWFGVRYFGLDLDVKF